VLTDELCAPARVPQPGEEYIAPLFDDRDEQEWWEPYEDTTDAIFRGIDEPVRLSQLVARAEQIAQEVCDAAGEPLDAGLLAASLVHAAHRAWATRLAGRSTGDRIVVAAVTGDHFDTGLLRSADLLLIPGTVTTDIAEHTARRSEATHVEDWDTDDVAEVPAA
jgi:hypothetical protein